MRNDLHTAKVAIWGAAMENQYPHLNQLMRDQYPHLNQLRGNQYNHLYQLRGEGCAICVMGIYSLFVRLLKWYQFTAYSHMQTMFL